MLTSVRLSPRVNRGRTVRDRAILPTYANRKPYHVSSVDRSVFTGYPRWRPDSHIEVSIT